MKLQKKLIDDYPETADVSVELRKKINDFSKNLPLIESLWAGEGTQFDQ